MKSRALNNPTLCKNTQQHLIGTAAKPDFHTARCKDGGDEDRIVRPKSHALLCVQGTSHLAPLCLYLPVHNRTHIFIRYIDTLRAKLLYCCKISRISVVKLPRRPQSRPTLQWEEVELDFVGCQLKARPLSCSHRAGFAGRSSVWWHEVFTGLNKGDSSYRCCLTNKHPILKRSFERHFDEVCRGFLVSSSDDENRRAAVADTVESNKGWAKQGETAMSSSFWPSPGTS